MNNLMKAYSSCLIIVLLFAIMPKANGQIKNNRPAFDSAKAKNELDKQNTAFITALNKSDSTALGNLYTADARILNGGESIIGRAKVTRFYGETVRAGVTNFGYTTTGLWGSDNNLVVEEGTLFFALSNGQVVTRGRYVLVWKKEEGQLKIFRDLFFPDKIKN